MRFASQCVTGATLTEKQKATLPIVLLRSQYRTVLTATVTTAHRSCDRCDHDREDKATLPK